MPGPGAHTMYALGVGAGLMRLSRGRFGPHHCLVYAANAFLGPDLGSFAEWLASCISSSSGLGHSLGSLAMDLVHHPFYYPMLLGLPLSFFYAWISALLLRKGILDPASGVSSLVTSPTSLLLPRADTTMLALSPCCFDAYS
ncbi:hypothetical protein BHE74_00039338 [Ensete ventricosum]|nr:hypothetical protein GW17_00024004 [Ensete ventricosum]RWW54114.1 hypothetical protein BHE74_00039338 [Ensete ventricosum]